MEQPRVEEFNNLVSFEDDNLSQRLTRFQGKRFNQIGQLNLVNTVLPFDQNRVKLRNPIDGYDYINASFICPSSSILYVRFLGFDTRYTLVFLINV